METKTFTCNSKCCTLKMAPYTLKILKNKSEKNKYEKAGAFIYDPCSNKVLLVQSCGLLWGLPKGTCKEGEEIVNCAIREIEEETGLKVDPANFESSIRIKNRAQYFYMEMEECPITVQTHIPDNDANGIGWVKPSCLVNLIKSGNMDLNYDCRTAFKIFRNINIPPKADNFITVKSRKNGSSSSSVHHRL